MIREVLVLCINVQLFFFLSFFYLFIRVTSAHCVPPYSAAMDVASCHPKIDQVDDLIYLGSKSNTESQLSSFYLAEN
jgi:hypothetical protein